MQKYKFFQNNKKYFFILLIIYLLPLLNGCVRVRCEHNNKIIQQENYVAGTCINEETWVENTVCADCNYILNSEIKKGLLGEHNYSTGECINCGKIDNLYGYNQLTSDEQLVFDAFIINIKTNFYNYETVRLEAATGFNSGQNWIYLKINGSSKLSGSSNWYQLYVKNYSANFGFSVNKGYLFRCSDSSFSEKTDILVSKINTALEYYWKK